MAEPRLWHIMSFLPDLGPLYLCCHRLLINSGRD